MSREDGAGELGQRDNMEGIGCVQNKSLGDPNGLLEACAETRALEEDKDNSGEDAETAEKEQDGNRRCHTHLAD